MKEINVIKEQTLSKLKDLGIDIQNIDVRVSQHVVEIGAVDGEGNFEFSGVVTYYASEDNILGKRDAEINFASSGSFNTSNKAATTRTILAASLLNNWDAVVNVLDSACMDVRKVLS